MPEGQDRDSYVNANGKDSFLNYFKENKVQIHEFLFNYYRSQSTNSPSSLAILEKKLKEITSLIKDEFIKKYILDFFLGKISNLTPNLSKSKQYAIKHVSSLAKTKKIFNETKSVTKAQLKEFSLFYLIINNLHFFKENDLINEEINFITPEGKKIFLNLKNYIHYNEDPSFQDLPIEKEVINKIEKFASIKHISNKFNKDPNKLLNIFNEMKKDLINTSIEIEISDLETQFSKDLNENTFNKIKELKKMQNIN